MPNCKICDTYYPPMSRSHRNGLLSIAPPDDVTNWDCAKCFLDEVGQTAVEYERLSRNREGTGIFNEPEPVMLSYSEDMEERVVRKW